MATTIATGALRPQHRRHHRGDPELRRRLHLAQGGGHRRRRDRRCGSDHADRRVRRPRRARSAGTSATWWFGLPSSSSHALIGGVVGATIAAAGSSAVKFDGLISKVLVPAVASPVVAGLAGRDRRLPRLPDDPPLLARPVRARVPLGPGRRRRRWSRSRTGPTTRRRPWASSALALIANGSLSGGDDFHVPDLGRRQLRDGDRARDLRRRLADHQDAGHQGRRGPPAAGLRLGDRRGDRDPRLLACRLPALDHTGGIRRRRRLGRRAPGRVVNWSSRATSSSAGCLRCPLPPPSAAVVLRRHRRARRRRVRRDRRQRGAGDRLLHAVACQPGQAGGARGDGLRSSRPSARRPAPEAVAA